MKVNQFESIALARLRTGAQPTKTQIMKRLLGLRFCFILALLNFSASQATADFVTPNVPARTEVPSAAIAPADASKLWTVSNDRDDGPGSLRYAIANAAPGDTIQFALHPRGFIQLKSTLVIDKDLTILGPGPQRLFVARSFARRTPSFSVFTVNSGFVTLAGMTILNGRAINPDGHTDNLGGGILNSGTLTVNNCMVILNSAPMEAGGRGFGGGIFSDGSLTILNSTFSLNTASAAGGGVCTFHSAAFRAEGCTVSHNFAGIQAGGVNFQGVNGRFKNCTISGNETAPDGTASGLLHIVFENEAADLALSACTVARNSGGTNAAVVVAALPNNNGIVTRMIGTLVADNEPRNFFLDGNPAVQSLGHNLDSDGTSGFTDGVNGDIVGTLADPIEARLGPLRNNGGPISTHALLPGSPALDASTCFDADGAALTTDQRGFPRPQGPACDIGAFEASRP
jgi:hypothetical protein